MKRIASRFLPAFLAFSVALLCAASLAARDRDVSAAGLPRHVVFDVYEDTLGREPSRRELAQLTASSADELRDQLRRSREFRRLSPEDIVNRAYREFHDRRPTAEEMRLYRKRFIDSHWSVGRIRHDIAQGGRGDHHERDHGDWSRRERDRIIERAYDDLLERKPDPAGLEHYRRQLERGLSEADLRARIRESEEYRVTLPDSKTRRAYLIVLRREADPVGLEGYRKRIVDRGWTQQDVEADLRRTAEYRALQANAR